MMKYIVPYSSWGLLIFLSMYSLHLCAQEIEIVPINRVRMLNDFSPCFNDRYQVLPADPFELQNTNAYLQQHIKKVEVYLEAAKRLDYTISLDSLGRITACGKWGRYYFISGSTDFLPDDKVRYCNNYIKDGLCEVKDTSYRENYSYYSGDTSMYYAREYYRKYLLGKVINEQNRYYNGKYYNKALRISNPLFMQMPDSINRSDSSFNPQLPHIYLRKLLRTDYDSLKWYCSEEVALDGNLNCYLQSSKRNVPVDSLKGHPFLKHYKTNQLHRYNVEGVGFIEPVNYNPDDIENSHGMDYDDGMVYGYTSNAAGLHDTYYVDYYAPLPVKTKQNMPLSFPGLNSGILTKREETAKRTVLYRFVYSY